MQKKKVLEKKTKTKNNYLSIIPSSNILKESKKNEFLQNYNLLLLGNYLFSKKGVLINDSHISKHGDLFIIRLSAFFRTKLLLKYRKNLIISKTKRSKLKKRRLKKSLLKPFFNSKKVLINLICLNRYVDKTLVKKDYLFYKPYKNQLFVRNYNLWLDFIKVTHLVINKALNAKALLSLFGLLFKYLHKRKHNKFIYFVTNLFDYIVKNYSRRVQGIKLVISGRLLSKPRSSIAKIERGTLNLTSKDACLISNQMHVYTLYGAFGLKLYINYQK